MPVPKDGRDADEQKIIKELEKTIAIKLESGLLDIKQSVPDPIIPKDGIDGRDADEEAIKKALLDYLRQEIDKIQHELSASIDKSIGAIPIPKDGVDGRDGQDADEKAIKDALFLELSNQIAIFQTLFDNKITQRLQEIIASIPVPKDGVDGRDGTSVDDQVIIDAIWPRLSILHEKSQESIKQKLLKVLLAKIEEITATLQPLQGERGRDGRDADDKKITREVLEIVSKDTKKSQALLQKELELGLKDIKLSIPVPKDGIDGKDGKSIKGEKGDRGNGIKDAEIDNQGHLIIKTDDKTIDAGEVAIKRFFGSGGGGSNFSYTNELPMPFDVGGLKKGTKFKDVDLKVIWTKLLYGYDLPYFANFTVAIFDLGNLDKIDVEIGYKILAGDYLATFSIVNPELLKENSIVISQDKVALLENLPNLSPITLTLAEIYKEGLATVSFEIFGYDTTGTSFNKYFNINYKYKIYYGEYTEDITDTGFTNPLIVLRASELINGIEGEYFYQNIAYKWFCYPEILGDNYVFYEISSDIALVLDEVRKIEITNEYGLKLTYNCYRTLNEIHEELRMDKDTIRIFSFPGGGTKGYGSNRFMQKFLHQWGIPQSDFWKYVDVYSGTSIGGILACGYAYGRTPDYMESFFLQQAKRVFTIRTAADVASGSHNASSDSNRPNELQKIALIATNDPFYKSAYEDSNYGHNILQQVLVDNFGTDTLANLKVPVVIPSFEQDMSRYVVFSNFNDPSYFIGNTESIVNVCRATSAAPIYLPAHTFNGHDYIDGGIYANDPILAAINIGLTVKPNATRIVIVDVGTGIGNMSFDGSGSQTGTAHAVEVLFGIMNIAMTGAEEWSRYYLDYLTNRLAKDVYYYKFQPKFPPEFPNELDNSSASWFADLANLIDTHYTNESDKISSILAHLTA